MQFDIFELNTFDTPKMRQRFLALVRNRTIFLGGATVTQGTTITGGHKKRAKSKSSSFEISKYEGKK